MITEVDEEVHAQSDRNSHFYLFARGDFSFLALHLDHTLPPHTFDGAG